MKIITWNCQGAYRRKSHMITELQPDIAIIQECERPEKLIFPHKVTTPNTGLWFGDAKKGIGVFSYSHYQFRLSECYLPSIRHCVPLEVYGEHSFNMVVIWAMNDPQRLFSYAGQIYLALREYRTFIKARDTVLIGDFNSNSIWDRKSPRPTNHSEIVSDLHREGIVSLYHEYYDELQGKETTKTLYMCRNLARGYHVDYCFAPKTWFKNMLSIQVGNYETWSNYSDHCPLIANFS